MKAIFMLLTFISIAYGLMPLSIAATEVPEASNELSNKYITTPTGYLMVLRKGDNVMDNLKQLAIAEHIPSASISGLGFINATFAYWDAEQKKYQPKEFKSMELASLTGSIAWESGQPSIHAHGVAIDGEFNAHGGHILDMQVDNGSVEITIIVHPQRLERTTDKTIDAKVLTF